MLAVLAMYLSLNQYLSAPLSFLLLLSVQPKVLTDMLQISNIIFTAIFVVEMVLKLLALTWAYFRDRNNIFDFVIVIIR